MKTVYKIFILLGVFLLIGAAISVFYNTQVAMPEKPKEINPYHDYLRSHSLSIVGVNSDGSEILIDSTLFMTNEKLEDIYNRQLLTLRRFHEEQLISDEEYDQQLDTFVWAYSKAFIYEAHRIFKEREWPENVRNTLVYRAKELNNILTLSNLKVLSNYEQEENLINGVIRSCADYSIATTLLANHSYNGIKSVKKRIETADQLVHNGYLTFNTTLISELEAYPSVLGDSHMHKIKNMADELADWEDNNSLHEILRIFRDFKSETDLYSSNGSIYKGGHPYDISDIVDSATNNKDEAVDELSTLYVDNNSSSTVTKYVDSSSGSITLSVNTNHPDGFSLDYTNSEWFSIESKGSDYVTITYTDNFKNEERNDYFKVIAGHKSIEVTLNQHAYSNNPTYNTGYVDGKSRVNWTSTHSGRITVSVSSNSGCDLDLTIIDDNGNIIVEDKSTKKNPSLTFIAPGHYTIQIYNYSESGCYYELREF